MSQKRTKTATDKASRFSGMHTLRANTLVAVVDQGVFSLSNVAVVLLAAHESLKAAGVCALVQVGYVVTTTWVQGGLVERLILDREMHSVNARRRMLAGATSLGWIFSGWATVIVLLTGGLSWLALVAPLFGSALVMQYAGRALAISCTQAGLALRSDTAWFLVQLGSFIALYDLNVPNAGLISWFVGGVAGLTLLPLFGLKLRQVAAEGRASLRGGLLYGGELLLGQSAYQMNYVSSTILLGSAATGAYRTGQICFAPMALVSAPLRQILLPRMLDIPLRKKVGMALVALTALAGIATTSLILLSVLPPRDLQRLLGTATATVRPARGWFYLEALSAAAVFVPTLLLRSKGMLRAGTMIRAGGVILIASVGAVAALTSTNSPDYIRKVVWGSVLSAVLWLTLGSIAVARTSERKDAT